MLSAQGYRATAKTISGMLLRSRYGGLTGPVRPNHALHGHSMHQKSYERQLVVHARGRRSATLDEEAEDVPEEGSPSEQQIIRSARRGMPERRNSRITRSAQPLVSPYQTLRDMNIVTADENGKTIIDLSCLGRGEPHWYAVGIVENKHDRYLELLTEVMDEYGISFDPKALYTPPAPGDDAAAAAAEALLQENEVTAWIPSKTMMVYSHNTDKLVERVVHYGRGTGGAWLLLHMTLNPLLVDLVQETYYYLGWRQEQEVSARMLEQAGILPRGEDREEVYKLPVPCTPDVLQQLISWQFTEEGEDLEQKRQEYYGIGSGSVFGELPTKAERLKGMERDAAGDIVQKRYSSGTYDNPSGWSEVPGSSSSSRGGRGSSSSSRGGRGGGRGHAGWDRWQQQQPLPWEDQQQQQQQDGWAVAGSSGSLGYDGGYVDTGYNSKSNNRNNNVVKKGGRDPNVRLQQMDYMQEMGSGRYSGRDSDYDWQQQQQQQQQGFSGRDSFGKPKGGRDNSVRHRQIDFMGEMGSDRYSDEDDEGLAGFNDDLSSPAAGFRGQQQDDFDLGFSNPKPRGSGYVRERGLGGRGDRVRQRQIDYMEEMGSDRYSSDDDQDQDQDQDWLPSSSSRGGGSSSSSSFLGAVAAAFEGFDQEAASLLEQQQQQQQRNLGQQQQQQQQWKPAAGPGKASFMEEDSLAWGDDNGAAAAAAAARQQYTDWQQEPAAADGFQGFNSSDLEFDDFANDDLLKQLAAHPPKDVAPKKKSTRKPPAAAAGAPRAAAAAAKKTKKVSKAAKNAAAKGYNNGEEGLGFEGVGFGVGSDNEGFEQGWVERLMADGNDRVGLDDVMKE